MSDNGYIIKFQEWAESLPDNMLRCREGRHRWADWEDRKAKARGVMGWVQIEVPCLRKCGVFLTRFVDPDTGYLTRSNRIRYEYEDSEYKIPQNARSGHGITKEMNAVFRAIRAQRLMESGRVEMEE